MGKQSTQIRLDDKIFYKMKIIADKEVRSLNGQMEYFIIKGVEEYEKEHGDVLPF